MQDFHQQLERLLAGEIALEQAFFEAFYFKQITQEEVEAIYYRSKEKNYPNQAAYYYLSGLTNYLILPYDYPQAFADFTIAAQLGSVEALSRLGFMHEKGLGCLQSNALSLEIYNYAIFKGSIQAINNLGSYYLSYGEVELAKEQFNIALQQGNTQAKINLAGLHFKEKNYTSAIDLYQQIAQRLPRFNLELGQCYQAFSKLDHHYDHANACFEMAIQHQSIAAKVARAFNHLHNYGNDCRANIGVQQLEDAIKENYGLAHYYYAWFHYQGIGFEKDLIIASKYLYKVFQVRHEIQSEFLQELYKKILTDINEKNFQESYKCLLYLDLIEEYLNLPPSNVICEFWQQMANDKYCAEKILDSILTVDIDAQHRYHLLDKLNNGEHQTLFDKFSQHIEIINYYTQLFFRHNTEENSRNWPFIYGIYERITPRAKQFAQVCNEMGFYIINYFIESGNSISQYLALPFFQQAQKLGLEEARGNLQLVLESIKFNALGFGPAEAIKLWQKIFPEVTAQPKSKFFNQHAKGLLCEISTFNTSQQWYEFFTKHESAIEKACKNTHTHFVFNLFKNFISYYLPSENNYGIKRVI